MRQSRKLKHNNWTVVVKEMRNEAGNLVPLSYDVFYNNQKINWILKWKHVRSLESAIGEHYDELNRTNHVNFN